MLPWPQLMPEYIPFPIGTWLGSESEKLGWKGEGEKGEMDGNFKETQNRALEEV